MVDRGRNRPSPCHGGPFGVAILPVPFTDMSLSSRCSRFLPVLTLAVAAVAQPPDAWTRLDVPTGVVVSNLDQLGKMLTYRDGGILHVWSSFTRRWDATSVPGAATTRISNDLVLISSPGSFTAFSSYQGKFDTISVGAGALVVNPAGNRNDSVWLVIDGTDLWTFSAFGDGWHRRTVQANPQIQVERNVAVVVESTQALGYSAFLDTWVATPLAQPSSAVASGGEVALVEAGGTLHGYAAWVGRWATWPTPSGAQLSAQYDVGVAVGATTAVGFSGQSGTFAATPVPLSTTVNLGEQVAYVGDGMLVHLVYTSVRNTWIHVPVNAPSPTVQVEPAVVMIAEADRAHGVSAIVANVATRMEPVSFTQLTRAVGALTNTNGDVRLYSAILGQWFDPPAGTLSQPPDMSTVGALVRTSTGFAVFSARTGAFEPLAASGGAIVHSDSSTAILAVEDGNRLSVFDGRRDRWITTTVVGPLQVSVWRTSLLAVDPGGARVYGYGSFAGHVASAPIGSTPIDVRASSEGGRCVLTDAVLAFSTSSDLLTEAQFPEFRRMTPVGANLGCHLQSSAPAGSPALMFLAVGLLRQPVPIGSLGDLEVDPTTLYPAAAPMVVDATGHGLVNIPVPAVNAVRGVEVAIQAVVAPTNGPVYLTQSASAFLF